MPSSAVDNLPDGDRGDHVGEDIAALERRRPRDANAFEADADAAVETESVAEAEQAEDEDAGAAPSPPEPPPGPVILVDDEYAGARRRGRCAVSAIVVSLVVALWA